jgi:hypothetical protein
MREDVGWDVNFTAVRHITGECLLWIRTSGIATQGEYTNTKAIINMPNHPDKSILINKRKVASVNGTDKRKPDRHIKSDVTYFLLISYSKTSSQVCRIFQDFNSGL